ncbi:hypothetical protein BGZ60DRAFT_469017 [Tricladium varicosporioides]|nr:hypothetical protein BGZ60DRAFT_469017 [Hymenoscyphus varicosporioides]
MPSSEHFTALYSPARKRAFTPKNIKASFAASSLFPFNPDRVLRNIPAPLAELAIPRVDEVKVGSCRQDIEPQTPVTPVSAEAFMSLQNLIIQDARALNETSKQKLVRYLQKGTKVFQKSSALEKLQKDPKVRRSTKSLVLGKAKVISYEDLVEARAKWVVKEATRAAKGKGKRGRKRKSSTLEAEEDTAEEDTAGSARPGRKCKSATLDAPTLTTKIARISNVPKPASTLMRQAKPWRALAAKM